MTRVRGALLAVVLAFAALAGWGSWAIHHAQQVKDDGPGLQDPAHLAAAHTLVDHLAVPVGALPDPYSSACHVPTTYCITSTGLTETQLVGAVTAQVRAAGGHQTSRVCNHEDLLPINCSVRFDLHGAHVVLEAGARPYVALLVSDAAALGTYKSKPLGPWASADPFPAGWVPRATCQDAPADGCNSYRNDWTHLPALEVSPTTAFGTAKAALTDAGFVLDSARCYAVHGSQLQRCTLSGFKNRTLGGYDGELVVLSIRPVDATHVQLLANLARV